MRLHSITHSEHRPTGYGRDMRRWDVRTDTERVGSVRDVYVDDEGRVRYVEVDLMNENNILVPAGHAFTDPENKAITLSGVSRASLRQLPRYDYRPGGLTSDREREVRDAYDAAYTGRHSHLRPEYRARDWGRGRPERENTGQLARLDELDDYEVADNSTDPRGWAVVDSDGNTLGRVDHLVGDTGRMEVRYLTVEIDRNLLDERRHVLVPAGHVTLAEPERRVIVGALDERTILELPAYEGRIDDEHARRVRTAFRGNYAGDRYYQHPDFGERSRVPSPEAEARKRIEDDVHYRHAR